MAGISYIPPTSVVVWRLVSCSSPSSTTWAEGTAAPLGSVTVPLSVAVPNWACNCAADENTSNNARSLETVTALDNKPLIGRLLYVTRLAKADVLGEDLARLK